MKNILTKVLSLLLVFSLIFMMSPSAFADSVGGEVSARVDASEGDLEEPLWNDTVYVADYTQLADAVKQAGSNNTCINLTDNIETTATLTVGKNQTLKITSEEGPFYIKTTAVNVSVINNSGMLWLENVKITGGNVNNTSIKYAGGITSSGTLVLTSDTLIHGNTGASYGGGVYNTGLLIMRNNGSVNENYAYMSNSYDYNYGHGGGVFNSGTFIMRDSSQISKNTATKRGGGVFNTNKFIIENGSIDHNFSPWGGGVYNENGSSYATFDMLNGKIEYNSARYGGGVYCIKTNSNMYNDSSVSYNEASDSGGGIYNKDYVTLTIYDNSTVSHNKTDYYGGGVYNQNSAFIMDGGTISNNTVTYGGGGVYFVLSKFTMKGNAQIADNTAGDYGGGIYFHGSNGYDPILPIYYVNFIDSPIIKNNKAGKGGGIYLDRYAAINIDSCVISGNVASDCGGGIYVNEKSTINTFGVVITGNTANQGGGIYNYESNINVGGSTIISQNTAWWNGGAIYSYKQISNYGKTKVFENAMISENISGGYGGGIYHFEFSHLFY